MPSSSISGTASPMHSLPVIVLHPSLVDGASSSFRLRSPSLNSVRLRHVFDIFDRDNDGVTSIDELSTALILLGLSSDPIITNAITSFIPSGCAGLDFPAFVALHNALGDALDEVSLNSSYAKETPATYGNQDMNICETFKVFNIEGDRYISVHELQVVLQKLGLPKGRCMDRVEEMIQSVDKDQNRCIDFEEFRSMMKSIVAESNNS